MFPFSSVYQKQGKYPENGNYQIDGYFTSGVYPDPPEDPIISGNAFPLETINSNKLGQWYVDNQPVIGEIGATYQWRLSDIGKTLRQENSNELVCWHPSNVTQVKVCRIHTARTYYSVSPDVDASIGQTIRRWTDIVGFYQGNQTTGASQPLKQSTGVYFDGVNDNLLCNELSVFRNVFCCGTIISANEENPNGGAVVHIVSFSQVGSGGATRVGIRTRNASTALFIAQAIRTDGLTGAVVSSSFIPGWNVLEAYVRYDLNALNLFVNGVDSGTATIPGTGPSSDTDSLLMRLGDSAGGFQGAIGCEIKWSGNTAPTDSDMRKLRRFAGFFCDPPKYLPL